MINLLVVEPSISVRKTLERLLETHGYTMRGVSQGSDALRQVGRQRPDLVLSEVELPDTTGTELCQQFWLAGLPVLLMSSNPSEQLRRESRDAGALDLLDKPISEQELLGRLAHHLRRPPLPPASVRTQPLPTLLNTLMTRPGLLGAGIYDAGGELVERVGTAIPVALFQPFLVPATAVLTSRTVRAPETQGAEARPAGPLPQLQCAQLEYPDHCLLLFRLPGNIGHTLVCLIQNSSYASLIKYHLRSSPYVRH